MAYPSNALQASIAVTRFGLGARPGELDQVARDPRGWLADQIRPAGADQPQANPETTAQRLAYFREFQRSARAERREMIAQMKDGEMKEGESASPAPDPVQAYRRMLRDSAGKDFLARARLGATTHAGFRERWTLFWCNHFTVSGVRVRTSPIIGPFEQEAIRPRVFGRFEDMLKASTAHPAMLTYLDQALSIGPDSRAAALIAGRRAKMKRPPGLNENLAREVMELHTVGVGGGYSQADVTEFARALTGWSIGALRESDEQAGRFLFRPAAHQPGARTVMGRTYPEGGVQQGVAILEDLAARPATARHVSRKIAAHFVADEPPPALVARLEKAWLDSDGDLSRVARALVEAPEAWDPAPAKLKTPYEFLISSWRAVGGQPGAPEHLALPLRGLGQQAFAPPSPKGWSDEGATWAAPDAIVKRMSWSQGFAAIVAGDLDTDRVAREALGARLTEPVQKAVARAESREEALAVLLMSPEFQRR